MLMNSHSNEQFGVRESIKIDSFPKRVLSYNVIVEVDPEPYTKLGKSNLLLGDIEDITTEKKRFNPAAHAVRHGVVRLVCEKKRMPVGKKKDGYVDIELQEGDLVWFSYYEGINAPLLEYKEKYFYILPYISLYVRKRGNEIYPLNGSILCTPKQIEEVNGIILGNAMPLNKAEVSFVGQMPSNVSESDVPPVGSDVYSTAPVIMLEDDNHLLLNGNPYRVLNIEQISAYDNKQV